MRLPRFPAQKPASTLVSPRTSSRQFGTGPWDARTGAPSVTLLKTAPYWRAEGFGHDPIDSSAIHALPSDATVVEYGPGYGDALPALRRAVTQGSIVVIDRSGEVIAHLRNEFGDSVCRFVQGERARDAEQPAASVDYMRARRVAPYLDEAGLRQLFEDAGTLLKPGGELFFTAYHPSQTPVDSFGTHTLAQVLEMSNPSGLTIAGLEVAIIPAGSAKPAETIKFDGAVGSAQEWDELVRERSACHAGPIEVELRINFRAPSAAHAVGEE